MKLRCVFTWFGVFCQYLQIYWIDFHNLFTIWKRFTCRWWIVTLFYDGNQIICQVQHGEKKWRILWNISGFTGPIFAIFSHMKALYVQMMTLYFFSKFGQLPSSNLGVYAVKTCNFCRHAPAILGRSLYVTMAFQNGLEDRNFDFSRVIGKHFCTPYRNLVRFGSVTPEFKI